MALVRWTPWGSGLQREMDLLVRHLMGDWSVMPGASSRAWVPAVDVFHRGDDLVIRAELPGIDPEKDVDLTLKDGVLTIRGERRRQEEARQNGSYRLESVAGSFSRSIALPESVAAEDIRAQYEDGILEVVVPRAATLTERKRIPIQSGGDREAVSSRDES